MVRTSCCSIRLMPQVASRVSSGRPYKKRITLRSSAAPISADAMNATGSAANKYQSNAAGQICLKHALHHIGGVGADHHQLAMRHVDDAHQAVGDGQPQRHQQQDRAQADAAEHRAQFVAPGQGRFDLAQRRLQGDLDVGIVLLGERPSNTVLVLGLALLASRRPLPGAWPCRCCPARWRERMVASCSLSAGTVSAA